jgi:hypothetical protein
MVRAQQGDRLRRIGVPMPLEENDPISTPRISAFTQALADLGWSDGRNARIQLRWSGGDPIRLRALALELVGLQPDIILTVAVQRETRTIPIVFANVSHPVANGLVPRLERPGGNITGFAVYLVSQNLLIANADNQTHMCRPFEMCGLRPAYQTNRLRPPHRPVDRHWLFKLGRSRAGHRPSRHSVPFWR